MPHLMKKEEAAKFNKAQADLIRAVANRIEAGEFETLAVDNQERYTLLSQHPFERCLAIRVTYREYEATEKEDNGG